MRQAMQPYFISWNNGKHVKMSVNRKTERI